MEKKNREKEKTSQKSTLANKENDVEVFFVKEKKLHKRLSFPAQYRLFRKNGLSAWDSFFNTIYIILSEKSVENEAKRLDKKGEIVSSRYFLDFHAPVLRFVFGFFAAIARVFLPRSKKKSGKGLFHVFASHRYLAYLAISLLASGIALYIYFILSRPLVLHAEINGVSLGTVENQNVVESAINNLEDNVEIILGESFRFPYEVRYTFARQKNTAVKTKKEISDQLYTYVEDFICTAGGLYVDDTLVAVCLDESTVQAGISDFISRFQGEGESGIFNDIRIVTQAYPTQSIITSDQLSKLLEEMAKPFEDRVKPPLSDSLAPTVETEREESVSASYLLSDLDYFGEETKRVSNQPASIDKIKLDLYTTKDETYETVLPYETEYQESADHYTSMADVTTNGADGKASVTARVFYVNGKEVKREVLSQKVLKEPRSCVISVGTKVLPEEQGITSFTSSPGRFIVPHVGMVYSYFGAREDGVHHGWDIPADEGENIYASASGTVVVAIGQDGAFSNRPQNHFSGYGYCVVIEHDDGFTTMYAHCSRINVTLGQKVKQGEKIAEIGNTGISEGNHVHFEIRQNGVALDPAVYLYKGNKTIN